MFYKHYTIYEVRHGLQFTTYIFININKYR